ncbi:hypothetical protein FEM48_Zijuj02G0121100 [Ziziphus jujuba var. spinosa]|uniref:Uncharacterized protein n=1 Tax=Ziziphus jujuba var. spinosa TaxID=714518 RepID=A0A978VVM5_ZIZJJ|nr:hypothetical protein FEM48_Zijuj02G0121100 [Ziziphus jujuba var. spinosa]
MVEGRIRYRYEKLSSNMNIEKVASPGRRHWVKKMNGRLKGLRLSRSRRLTLKVFSVVVLSSRIGRIYTKVVNRMKIEGGCPAIIFSTPVLSHPSVKCGKKVSNIDRNSSDIISFGVMRFPSLSEETSLNMFRMLEYQKGFQCIIYQRDWDVTVPYLC